MYAQPAFKGKIVEFIDTVSMLTIFDVKNGWCLISTPKGNKGYAHGNWLTHDIDTAKASFEKDVKKEAAIAANRRSIKPKRTTFNLRGTCWGMSKTEVMAIEKDSPRKIEAQALFYDTKVLGKQAFAGVFIYR